MFLPQDRGIPSCVVKCKLFIRRQPFGINDKPFSERQILDFQTVMFADDNLKFGEHRGKFSNWVKNTVGKGEIAPYEQFLRFPRGFQKTSTADTLKQGLVGERCKGICR